jgi:pimeloyl-ACP methyl ester carboxylesterase
MPAGNVPAVRERRVDADGARLLVAETGAGEPMLLVHGWALDHRVFDFQTGPLGRHFRVITFDRRGFGRSQGEPDLRRELDDIDAILDALGVESVHLLGMSQGGRLALRYAASRPARIRSLILQGAAVDGLEADGPEAERIPIGEFVRLAKQGRMDEMRSRWMQHPMMTMGVSCEEESALLRTILADYRGADLLQDDPVTYRYDQDVLGALAAAAPPMLLLTGERETAARRALAERIAAAVPGARERLLPRGGHLSNLTEPAAYNAAVIEFCQQVDARRRASASGTHD